MNVKNKVVWKFELHFAMYDWIQMPKEAQILHVAHQNNIPYVWALVDPRMPTVSRRFLMLGTGHSHVNDVASFIGTFMVEEDNLVFHLFDLGEVD